MPFKTILAALIFILLAGQAAAPASARGLHPLAVQPDGCQIHVPAAAGEVDRRSGYTTISVTLLSTAADHFRGQGQLRLSAAQGSPPLWTGSFDVPFLMAGDSLEQFLYPRDFPLPPGRYWMALRLAADAGRCEQVIEMPLEIAARGAGLAPLALASGSGLLALAAGGLLWKKSRRRSAR